MENKIQKIFAISGIIGPISVTILIIILGFYKKNYNHISQYISELGAVNAPYANIMNILGFLILGILIIFFSIGLYNNLKENNTNKFKLLIGTSLLSISGLAFIMIAFFPCDPNCINTSLIGTAHGYFANIAQFSLMVAPLFLFQKFKKDSRWTNYWILSLLMVIIGLTFALIYKINTFESYKGLLQRISFGLPLIWVEITSIKLFRLSIKN